LTEKERDILDWISIGVTDKEVAYETGLKLWTVRDRLRRIFRTLKVHSRSGATAAWCNRYRGLQTSVASRARAKG